MISEHQKELCAYTTKMLGVDYPHNQIASNVNPHKRKLSNLYRSTRSSVLLELPCLITSVISSPSSFPVLGPLFCSTTLATLTCNLPFEPNLHLCPFLPNSFHLASISFSSSTPFTSPAEILVVTNASPFGFPYNPNLSADSVANSVAVFKHTPHFVGTVQTFLILS